MNWIGDLPHIGRLARLPYIEMMRIQYQKMGELGLTELNQTHSVIFQTIGEGARLTQMAKKANLSKQNIKHLINSMEKLGFVESTQDPTDGRAIIYRLTTKGVNWRDQAYDIIGSIENKWAESIGVEKMIELKKLLIILNESINSKP